MFLTLLMEAALGGAAEALAAAGIEKAPHLAERIRRTVDLVERQNPTAVESAIREAVEHAQADLLDPYKEAFYTGHLDNTGEDFVALLNHPPFAEEVTRKLLYRGQPDFERLRHAYLQRSGPPSDERWAALELPLLDFFEAIERHLLADATVGPLLRHLQQMITLTRLEATGQIVADASLQIQAYQARIADAGEETAGGIGQLIALSSEQVQTLRDLARFLRENAGRRVQTNGGAYIEGSADIDGDFVNRDKIVHIYHVYRSAPGQPILDEAGFTAAVGRYLHWVRNRYGQLNLRGVQRRERQALTLTLEDVYVSLQAMVTPKRNHHRRGKKTGMPEEQAEPQTVDMAQLLALGERLVIIGGPGSGKTTFLHIIASALAQALLTGELAEVSRYLGLTTELPLPIFVTLSDYNRYRRQCEDAANHDPRQGTLTAFISHSLIRQEAALGLPADFFERLLGQGKRCIVLLDGLDEVADERERMLVRQAVENLAANQGVGQMLVTSRTRAFQGRSMLAEEFRVAEVQPMALEQAQALAARWCKAVYDETRAKEQATRLQEAITTLEAMRRRRGEQPLVDSPLMVTIVAIVHYNDRRLPDERADLYTRCVDVLLAESYKPESQATFDLVDWGGNERDKRSLLAYLAFCMMSAGETSGRSADEAQIRSWLRPRFARLRGEEEADAALDTFLQAMSERGSLLDERGRRYQFIHLTFQEFLCAAHLVDTVRERNEIVRLLFEDGRIAQSWWRETVLLTVGYMGLGSIDAPLTLVQTMTEHVAEASIVVGAVEVATAAFLEQNGQDAATADLLRQRLVALISGKEHSGSPQQRLAAGKALSRLGDPRRGVGLLRPDGPSTSSGQRLPDLDWVKIPERDARGRIDFLYGEKGERRREPTFWMARYPVTYAQFQAFVDAEDGLRNPRWWQGLARTDNDDLAEQAFKVWNHPRERVTWYQALAFCRWLTEKAKTEPALLPPEARAGAWRMTLPTEWQWEKAARGHEGLLYPWGNEYISGYANVDETERGVGPHKLGQTSAVGLYPQGASPYGILDLSGNVWEWCLNEYNNPERFQDEGSSYRVVRGGSWYSGADRATASARNHWLLNDRVNLRRVSVCGGPHLSCHFWILISGF